MNTGGWEVIKDFYQREFGIDGWVVEMYANLDILALSVAGASVDTISTFLELPIAEAVKVNCDVFGFDGWRKDLPINPYRVYNLYTGTKGSVDHFVSFSADIAVELGRYSGFDEVKPEKLFYMCETYGDIEERIQNEWI
jgi:hypothetical protein